jgi:CheY-like chemotaxis protein
MDSTRLVVLHVEDNVSNRRLVQLVAEQRPAIELVEAHDGASAIELARARRPDLVLLDLRLPDIPGEEVLERLRSEPGTAALRVVVISAEARPEERGRLIDAGANGYLVKPFEVEELLDILDSIVETP